MGMHSCLLFEQINIAFLNVTFFRNQALTNYLFLSFFFICNKLLFAFSSFFFIISFKILFVPFVIGVGGKVIVTLAKTLELMFAVEHHALQLSLSYRCISIPSFYFFKLPTKTFKLHKIA